jgi:hypothetical protein
MNPSARRKLILGGVVAVLAAWLVLPLVLRHRGPAEAQAAASADADVAGDDAELVTPLLLAVAALPAAELPVDQGWPADPFQRLRSGTPDTTADSSAAPTDVRARPVLNGIIGGSSPRALIQGQIVAVGDRVVGGYTVTAIDAYSVTLEGPQGPWTLTLPQ